MTAVVTHTVSRPDPMLRVQPVGLLVAAPTGSSRPTRARQTSVSSAWVARTARAAGIPAPAVRAYGAATLRELAADPGCHLAWTTLAGVGWVESQHGTLGGLRLGADGRPSRQIDGPVLDGSGDVAAVPGDAGSWQRATGPLQFIPSTGSAGAPTATATESPTRRTSTTRRTPPHATSARPGPTSPPAPGWSAAIFSYNHSDAYVRSVYDAAQAYADRTAG